MSLKLTSFNKPYVEIPSICRNPSNNLCSNMLILRYPPQITTPSLDSIHLSRNCSSRYVVVCGLKGPRPRYPRVWKTQKKIGTISKSAKLVDCIKGLSNVKEEVYGALDAFIAWDLEFPLITVKKALKTLEYEKEWKRIIQVTKWMLSKGQGRTMGSYFALMNALGEEDRIDEVEELWTKLFTENLESTPRMFFDKMISIYYSREMYDKMFDVFADMEELGLRPTTSIVSKIGAILKKLGMKDKYEKLNQKYPPPKWEYKYIKGKRVKVRYNPPDETSDEDVAKDSNEQAESTDTGIVASDGDKEHDKQTDESLRRQDDEDDNSIGAR